MKLYNSVGPNPQVVRSFMAERGVTMDMEEIDIMAGDNRKAPFLDINPAGQLPAMVMKDGSILTEITAICEYLDDVNGASALIGKTPEDRARTRQWTRWVDLNVCEPLANGFRFSEGLPMFESRMRCLPEASSGLKACAQDKLGWLDKNWNGRKFIAGDDFTLADILLHCFLTFGEAVGQPLDRSRTHVANWYDAVKQRPSMAA